jgi:mannosyltransferase
MIWAILLLGLCLRLISLNQSLWLDEASHVLLSGQSLNSIIFERASDFHPPLAYILWHYWQLIGTGDIILRLPSVIFGVLTIWILFHLVKKSFGENVAVISSFLLAIAPFHIYYSQEIRMYSLVTLLGVISFYFFQKLLEEKRFITSLGFIISTAALIYTHYMGIFIILSQLIYLLFNKRSQVIDWSKNYLIIGLLYLPWFPQFIKQLSGGTNANDYLPGWSNILSLSFYKAIPLTLLKFSIGRINFDNNYLYAFIAVIVISIFGVLIFLGIKSIKNHQQNLVAFWFFIPLLVTWLISFWLPMNQPFRLLFIIPAFYILLAVGMVNLKRYARLALIGVSLISLLGTFTYLTTPKFWREDWRGAMGFITRVSNEKTVTVLAWPEPFAPIMWYGKNIKLSGVVKRFPADMAVDNELIKLQDFDQIYYFEYLQDLSDPNGYIEKWFSENGYKNFKTFDFRGVGFIREYEK